MDIICKDIHRCIYYLHACTLYETVASLVGAVGKVAAIQPHLPRSHPFQVDKQSSRICQELIYEGLVSHRDLAKYFHPLNLTQKLEVKVVSARSLRRLVKSLAYIQHAQFACCCWLLILKWRKCCISDCWTNSMSGNLSQMNSLPIQKNQGKTTNFFLSVKLVSFQTHLTECFTFLFFYHLLPCQQAHKVVNFQLGQ